MDPLPGVELANDADDNPCFACGPRNPYGLHLRFFDDGEHVRARLALDETFCGWPGSVLEGIVYSAMDDTLYWTSCVRMNDLPVSDGYPEVEFPGRVKTNVPFTIEAWEMGVDPEGWTRFAAEVMQEGQLKARMGTRMRLRTPEETRTLLEIPNLPRSLRQQAEEMLSRGL